MMSDKDALEVLEDDHDPAKFMNCRLNGCKSQIAIYTHLNTTCYVCGRSFLGAHASCVPGTSYFNPQKHLHHVVCPRCVESCMKTFYRERLR